MTDPRLWDGAACRGCEPSVFFPDEMNSAEVRKANIAAVAICNQCPHVTECLEYAVANNERHGIWGGRTPSQRARQRTGAVPKRPRLPIVHGTANGYQAHRRRGIAPCGPCSVAWRAYDRERRLRKAAREQAS